MSKAFVLLSILLKFCCSWKVHERRNLKELIHKVWCRETSCLNSKLLNQSPSDHGKKRLNPNNPRIKWRRIPVRFLLYTKTYMSTGPPLLSACSVFCKWNWRTPKWSFIGEPLYWLTHWLAFPDCVLKLIHSAPEQSFLKDLLVLFLSVDRLIQRIYRKWQI